MTLTCPQEYDLSAYAAGTTITFTAGASLFDNWCGPGISVTDSETITVGGPGPRYVYSCVGFDRPFDSPILLKKGQNRAISVKMQLFDKGTIITSANIVGAPPVIDVEFSSGAAAAVHAAGTFRFDPDIDRWVYVLKTEPYTAVGTYAVTVVPGDELYDISPTCRGQVVRPK